MQTATADTVTALVGAATLTKDDLKALRTADDGISFHTLSTGDTCIRAHKRLCGGGDIWTGDRAHHEIACGVSWTVYSGSYSNGANGFTSAYASIGSTQYNPVWLTVAKLLKVGDRLSLNWIGDNNNDLVKEAGLHHDQLELCVYRTDNYVPLYTLKVDDRISLDNSARMLRRY